MKGGIPQGSALEPLLFLIYINSLPLQISQGLLLQYADDTALICGGPSPIEAGTVMNSQLALIQQWIVTSRMKLNHSKSTVMWFKGSSRKKSFEFPNIVIDNTTLQVVTMQKFIDNTTLQVVTKQKYLGVIFDDCFVWNNHVSHICKKMSYYLYIISKHKQVLNSNLMKLLIDPLVFSHLNYSLPVWGPSLHQNRLQ